MNLDLPFGYVRANAICRSESLQTSRFSKLDLAIDQRRM